MYNLKLRSDGGVFCTAKIPLSDENKKSDFFEPAVTKSFGARISPWMNIPITETTGLHAVSAI